MRPGDLARDRHRLGLFRRVVVVVLDDDRRLGENQSGTGLETPVGPFRRYSKPSSVPMSGVDQPAKFQLIERRRIAGRGDGDGQLFQDLAVDHRARIEFAAGQIAAIQRDLGRLARLDHRRKDGVDVTAPARY